ncbi:chloroplast sensor kinase, chloroplastic isoform X2 [Andrographis paniculata]|uniref:chloroplast sensor kinase, chloroplastic isoform X2 n=1 Tax=Andrographis paniculata TaxID=175694 RepID=UPI0021E7F8C9|nr:chloroplast sensor kinase, chloroplastic isoform X2 [Andrographis paniculata]
MMLSTFPPQTPVSTTQVNYNFTPPFLSNGGKYGCRATTNTSAQRPLFVAATASTSIRQVSCASDGDDTSLEEEEEEEDAAVSSADAVVAMIRAASTSTVEFTQTIEKSGAGRGGSKSKALVLPSQDFQRLCLEQLHLFRRIVDPDALLSVYVRPADSYVMDRLELRRITLYPGVHSADIVVLVCNFGVPAGLRVAEAAIMSQQAEFFPELGAVVFPMVTHPFIVGFLVAEFPKMFMEKEWHDVKEDSFSRTHSPDPLPLEVQTFEDHSVGMLKFSSEQKLNAINITRSLAMAYVMDQKAMLLQQSAWQNNVRMSNLVEQIRGSLSGIHTLSKMLSIQLKRSEIAHDIVDDILVQGDHIRDALQQLQDAVYLTKANILRYNNESLKKIQQSSDTLPEEGTQLSNNLSMESSVRKLQESSGILSIASADQDSEFPMPPLALASSYPQEIRPCEVSDVLQDLVGAIKPLAQKQQRVVELCDLSSTLKVAVEEPALRQALSNLVEGALLRTKVGGRIDIVSTIAPAGGVLIVIDDDGPDMHYMTQMHSLTPFGPDLYGKDRIEDNMTWNFIAGLTVAREILEGYGCVVRVISPRSAGPVLGAGGTRVEIWLPSFPAADAQGIGEDA